MKVVYGVSEWLAVRAGLSASERIGFVPTMGALHEGHASLLSRSIAECEVTVLSIYVNPTQFNNPDDLARYPDTLSEDLHLAQILGVDFVVLPRYEDLYADDFRYQVHETEFSLDLCGANRPGHFTGVLTVVMKLLNIVRPARAYFGKKDFQQYRLIQDMCTAFFMPVEIVGCETVREADGLAMSSRNKLLDKPGREKAVLLHSALQSSLSDAEVCQHLQAHGFTVDYIVSRDGRRYGAVVVECEGHPVRLIDNVASVDGSRPGAKPPRPVGETNGSEMGLMA